MNKKLVKISEKCTKVSAFAGIWLGPLFFIGISQQFSAKLVLSHNLLHILGNISRFVIVEGNLRRGKLEECKRSTETELQGIVSSAPILHERLELSANLKGKSNFAASDHD